MPSELCQGELRSLLPSQLAGCARFHRVAQGRSDVFDGPGPWPMAEGGTPERQPRCPQTPTFWVRVLPEEQDLQVQRPVALEHHLNQ